MLQSWSAGGCTRSLDNGTVIETFINRLPPELLLEIFEIYILHSGKPVARAGYSLQIYGSKMSRRLRVGCRALGLAGICSRWRSIVLAKSSIWSSFHLDVELFRDRPQLVSLLNTYISYSQSALLSISLHMDSSNNMLTSVNTETQQILNVLFECAHCWKSAKLTILDEKYILYLNNWYNCRSWDISANSKPVVAFSSLENLEIEYSSIGYSYLVVFQLCPQLKTYRVNLASSTSEITLPDVSHVEEFHLGSEGVVGGPSIGHLLCQMPMLKICAIEGFYSTRNDIGVDTEQVFPNRSFLTSLKVWSHTFHLHAWKDLHLPNLTTLEVYHIPFTETRRMDVSQFVDVLMSASSLQKLKLEHLPELTAIALLGSCPSITTLHLLVDGFQGVDLFKRMTPAVPRLSVLTVHLSMNSFTVDRSEFNSFQDQLAEAICCFVDSRFAISGPVAADWNSVSCTGEFAFLEQFTLDAIHFGYHVYNRRFWYRLSLISAHSRHLKIISNSTTILQTEGNGLVASHLCIGKR
ncbi:hypothetical protein GG344DRAFT_82739 [Lentinula edodes]|nr:hypothetical protein GG344DRAFT_82739 [Lentinula edodes]KAJ3912596.1 hypothetical protein F5877DRAFT_84645 [Lentinula edodes]